MTAPIPPATDDALNLLRGPRRNYSRRGPSPQWKIIMDLIVSAHSPRSYEYHTGRTLDLLSGSIVRRDTYTDALGQVHTLPVPDDVLEALRDLGAEVSRHASYHYTWAMVPHENLDAVLALGTVPHESCPHCRAEIGDPDDCSYCHGTRRQVISPELSRS